MGSRAWLVWLGMVTCLALAGLIGLGVWQLKRLAWKEGLIAEVAARADAAPVDAPGETDWAKLRPSDYEYRHVRSRGVYEFSREALVFRALERARGRFSGPGYLVMTPLRLAGGAHVIVNRGFVPQDQRDRFAAPAPDASAQTTVTGLMRSSEPRNWFTPPDDPARGQWYTRDPAAIASALNVERAAPFTIDADAGSPGLLPQGGETVLTFPNNHLGYALTWFGMAVALVGVSVAFAAARLRAERASMQRPREEVEVVSPDIDPRSAPPSPSP
jgi:surfeit locus 1 family protein